LTETLGKAISAMQFYEDICFLGALSFNLVNTIASYLTKLQALIMQHNIYEKVQDSFT